MSDSIPGPGVLTVHLGPSDCLSLPHDPDLQQPQRPVQGTSSRDVRARYRWRLYAIVEYEGFQVSSEATYVKIPGLISWGLFKQPLQFDVSASPSSEMTVFLFARDKKGDESMSSEGYESQVIPLGLIKVNPFLIQRNGPGSQNGEYCIDVQNGTGTLKISTLYSKKEIPTLKTKNVWSFCNESGVDGLVYVEDLDIVCVEKKDTGRSYGMQTVGSCYNHTVDTGSGVGINMIPSRILHSGIQHPFIAPPKFAFKSTSGVNLLSPLASGGYLFDQLQKERRFGVDRTRFYAAQLVCILEYLHSRHVTVASLRPENILLDSSGNISLCKPRIIGLDSLQNLDGDTDRTIPGTPEYPAPETLLHNQKPSQAVDWWNLGVILYEMLSGIPPFYSKDHNERRHKIIGEDLQLPESLPSTVKDILARLLDKDSMKRLGVNGAAEVKSHPFFHRLKWDDCLEKKIVSPFKPHDATTVCSRESAGVLYKETDLSDMLAIFNYPANRPQRVRESLAVEEEARVIGGNVLGDDRWDLVWDHKVQEFYFENRCAVDERAPATPEATIYRRQPPPPATVYPSGRQKEDALGAALQARYSNRVILQILGTKPNLDASVLHFEYTPTNSQLLTNTTYARPVTALEWAVEFERLDLVNLFLDRGTNVNSTHSVRDGPALLKAVRKRNNMLVEILVQKTTDRVSRTRALALAIEQEDAEIATILLTHGVCCDFQESDRPLLEDPLAYQSHNSLDPKLLRAEDMTPPLIRAARLGNVALIKLLLAHGADANISYHELGGRGRPLPVYGFERTDVLIPASFSCGRAVQIAMEMGHSEIVHLLLDAGADIDLEHSAWPVPAWPVPGHICQPVRRVVYLEVTAGLEAAAKRRSSKE
jgi:serum/glucocorticoid-regulated kinase 2